MNTILTVWVVAVWFLRSIWPTPVAVMSAKPRRAFVSVEEMEGRDAPAGFQATVTPQYKSALWFANSRLNEVATVVNRSAVPARMSFVDVGVELNRRWQDVSVYGVKIGGRHFFKKPTGIVTRIYLPWRTLALNRFQKWDLLASLKKYARPGWLGIRLIRAGEVDARGHPIPLRLIRVVPTKGPVPLAFPPAAIPPAGGFIRVFPEKLDPLAVIVSNHQGAGGSTVPSGTATFGSWRVMMADGSTGRLAEVPVEVTANDVVFNRHGFTINGQPAQVYGGTPVGAEGVTGTFFVYAQDTKTPVPSEGAIVSVTGTILSKGATPTLTSMFWAPRIILNYGIARPVAVITDATGKRFNAASEGTASTQSAFYGLPPKNEADLYFPEAALQGTSAPDVFHIQVHIRNLGPQASQGGVLSITLPEGTSVVQGPQSMQDYVNGILTINVQDLFSTGEVFYDVEVKLANGAATLSTDLTLSSYSVDPVTTNNSVHLSI